ncbi:MAG: PD40 domain-containing protein, partial [Planctomycetaceae bacterium]|nr:PD40 domain-containing protein [Planctomycetaceae bacterium]
MNTELNLLVAMRALALGLIDDERFRVVCRGWSEDRTRSVEQRLVESCGIDDATRQRLMEDVGQHVSLAGDDPVRAYQEELAQDSRVASLVCELDDDPVVAGTLDEQPRDGHVLIATLGEEPGDPTVGPNAEVTQMRYTLHRVYGKGGLGQVWMAQDRTLNRRVALKELKPGRVKHVDSPATRGILRRFLREAQITGQLQHPNIVPVYDVERRDGGLPFYTMKLVEGQTFAKAITEYHERRKAGQDDPVEFARLLQAFVGVCQAVAYANANGVVHRDLKPQNVVLGGFGEVIVLDWGEAKLVRPTNSTGGVAVTDQEPDALPQPDNARLVEVTADAADLEKTCGLVGTPAYLSPEQADQRIDDVDQRTDVYGLGTILFHVVAGISPHGSRPGEKPELDLRKLIDRIITEPTPRLREFNPSAAPALDAVCAKAMAKSQAERYASGTELAKDVQRFLADEPVSVLSEPLSVRISRWMKRHRTLVTTTAVALIVAIIGVSVLAAMSSRHAKVVEKANEKLGTANRNLETANQNLEVANKNERAASERATQKATEAQLAEKKERKAREDAEAALARSRYFLAQTQAAQGRVLEAHDILDTVPKQNRLIEWQCSRRQFEGSFATLHGHAAEVRAVCLSPDGRRIASASATVPSTDSSPGQIIVWDAITGAELLSISAHSLGVTCVCFSPDGQRLASGSHDKTVRLWDANTGEPIRVLRGHSEMVANVCFAAEGTRLVSAGHDDRVKIWEVALGTVIRTLTGDRVACVSRDGRKLATSGRHTTISLWDAQTGEPLSKMKELTTFVTSMCFSDDGRKLVSTDGAWMAQWNLQTGKVQTAHRTVGHDITGICLSPDGQQIASAGGDDTIKLWNASTWQELATFKGHAKDVTSVCFTADGQRLISASQDKSIKLWDTVADNTCLTIPKTGVVNSLAIHPQSDQLASAHDDKTIRVWNARTGEELRTLRGHAGPVRAVSYRPDGQWLASGSDDQTIRLWDAASDRELKVLSGHTDAVTTVSFSPDGKYLASGSADQTIKLWDAMTGDELRTLTGHTDVVSSLSFSADGQRLASVSGKYRSVAIRPSEIMIWNSETGERLKTIPTESGLMAVALSPDGQQLATNSLSKEVKLWDIRDAREVAMLALTVPARTFISSLGGLAWSADGQRLAVANPEAITVWDVGTQEALVTFPATKELSDAVHSPVFSRDGLRLAFVSNGSIKLSGPLETNSPLILRGHQSAVRHVLFNADGRLLATTGYDHIIRLWDVPTGRELHRLPGPTFPSIFFRADGRVLAATKGNGARLFDVGTGRELVSVEHASIKNTLSGVRTVAFSLDGKKLATLLGGQSLKGEIKIWNAQSGAELRAIMGHSEKLTNVAFSEDGQRLFARDVQDKVMCWNVETGDTVDAAGPPAELSRNPDDRVAPTRSRDGRWLAIPLQNHVRLIDRQQPLPPDEQTFREAKSRLDPLWHSQQAESAEKARQWYAASFHFTLARMGLAGKPTSEWPQPLRDLVSLERLKFVCQKLADEPRPAGEPVSFPRATIELFAKLNESLPTPAPVKRLQKCHWPRDWLWTHWKEQRRGGQTRPSARENRS